MRMRILSLFVVLISINLSCRTTTSQQSAVIGSDDRRATNLFASSVGALLVDGNKVCTAFISAPHEITTALHCLREDSTEYSFLTADGKKSEITSIKILSFNSDVVVLNSPEAGPAIGFSKYDPSQDAYLISYDLSSSTILISPKGTAISDDSFLQHELDTVQGSSGSPVLQGNKFVGVHIGTLKSKKKNLAVLSDSYSLAKVYEFGGDFIAERGFKIPKKIGGSVGQAIGQITNPIRDNVTAPLGGAIDNAINSISNSVARQVAPSVADQARNEAWTSTSCVSVGASAILLPAATYIAPACAASAFITGGMGTPACVAGVSSGVVAATCIVLCETKNLSDCR